MLTVETEVRIDTTLKIALYEAHQGCCFYTGRHLPIEEMEIDHIQPRRKSGLNRLDNLVLAAADINRLKSDRQDDEAIERMLYINRLVFAPRVLTCLDGKLALKVQAPEIQISCEWCGMVLITKRPKKRFCSDICRVRAWQKKYPRVDPTTGQVKQKSA